MKLLYQIALAFYSIGIHLAAPFSPKASLWVKGRKDWRKKLPGKHLAAGRKIAWFHCASLGEFEQARPLIEKLDRSQYAIYLTFFSPSGYEVRKNYAGADWIGYLPLDTPANARDFVKGTGAALVVFVKYEFWNFFLHEIKKSGAKFYLVSAVFRPEQRFFKRNSVFYKNMLLCYHRIFVQDNASAELLDTIDIKQVTMAGDTRFDRVWENARVKKDLPLVESFTKGYFSLVAGSCWPPEEERISAVFESFPGFRWVLVPHDIDENHLKSIEERFPGHTIRYSELERNLPANGKRVLIIDKIGILADSYRYAQVALVGGGFKNALHNILEAAVQGIPVLFGPHTAKYPEAGRIVKAGGGFAFNEREELQQLLEKFSADIPYREQAGKAAFEWIDTNRGATTFILHEIT